MKLKSFFAGSVEAALGLAREELGSEAVLVNSRRSPPEAKHLGEYEVVAASLPDGSADPGAAVRPRGTAEPLSRRPSGGTSDDKLRREFADLRRQMEQVRKAVWFSGFSRVPAAPPAGPTADMLATLLEAEVEPALAREIATCVEARLAGDPLLKTEPDAPGDNQNGGQSERRNAVLIAELERRFNVDPLLGYPDSGPRIAAVVGPPGAGKTTTLAKLAVACGLRRNRSVQLLSLDTYRIASSEPLRTYAGILGAGLQALASPKAVDQAIKAAANKDLILIDTPGFGPRDMDAAAEIAARFSSLPEIQVHLVLPATLKSADLIRAVDRFDLFRPSRLLFTRVDETSTFGPAFSEAARTAKPVSYLAAGQQVPEDLQEATKQRIVELMLERFCE